MILSIVMTHKEAINVVRAHLPIWQNINGDIIFTSPKDSTMDFSIKDFPELYEYKIGEAEHNGEKSAQRIIEIFEFALTVNIGWDHLLLMEYDAFALDLPKDVFPEECGVSAARYEQNKPGKYKGEFYLHYPMLFDRSGAEKVLETLPSITTNDRYMSDRFIGMAAQKSGINVKDLRCADWAWTKNTILDKHILPVTRAAKKGVVFYHGVKTEKILNVILNNYKKR